MFVSAAARMRRIEISERLAISRDLIGDNSLSVERSSLRAQPCRAHLPRHSCEWLVRWPVVRPVRGGVDKQDCRTRTEYLLLAAAGLGEVSGEAARIHPVPYPHSRGGPRQSGAGTRPWGFLEVTMRQVESRAYFFPSASSTRLDRFHTTLSSQPWPPDDRQTAPADGFSGPCPHAPVPRARAHGQGQASYKPWPPLAGSHRSH